MEEGSVKQEKYAVIITPGTMAVAVDIWDLDAWNEERIQRNGSRVPLISEWGYTREHAIRRTLATVLRDQGFLLMAEDDRHGYV